MSLIFLEGWNGYKDISDITTNSWVATTGAIVYNSGCTSISNSVRFTSSSTSNYLTKTIDHALLSNNIFCGMAFRISDKARIGDMLRIGNIASQYIGFFNNSSFIGCRNNAAFGGVSFKSNIPLENDTTYYLEIGVISNSAIFRVNGLPITTLELTVPLILKFVDAFRFTSISSPHTHSSDIYCCDDLGDGPFNTFAGPLVVQKANIIATGTNVNFTGNYTDVDETASDNATTKISSSDPNAKFTVKVAIPENVTVLGYSFKTNVYTAIPNFLGVSLLEQLNENEVLSTPKITLAGRSDYYWQHQVYREKLPGDLPLTKANLEAAEFGVKLIDMR